MHLPENFQAMHSLHLVLGHYYDSRVLNQSVPRPIRCRAYHTPSFTARQIPLSPFSHMLCVALGCLRIGDYRYNTKQCSNLQEDLGMFSANAMLQTAEGQRLFWEANLFAHFIDANDLDLRLLGRLHDAVGHVVFVMPSFRVLDLTCEGLHFTASMPDCDKAEAFVRTVGIDGLPGIKIGARPMDSAEIEQAKAATAVHPGERASMEAQIAALATRAVQRQAKPR